MVIAEKIREMTIAVIIARSRMRRLAVVNTVSGAGETLGLAALLVEGLDDLHRAQHFAGDRADVGDAVLALVEMARSRRPRMMIGITTSGMPSSSMPASLGASTNRMTAQAMPMTRLRSATETVVPTTCSMIVVSTVIRLVISAGRFSSKKPGRGAAGCDAPQGGCRRRPARRASDEIEAHRRGQRHHDHEHQQILEPAGDVAAAGEAAVDDQLEGVGHAEVAAAATSSATAAAAMWLG